MRTSVQRYLKHYLMIAPFFILFTVFFLAPMLYGLGMGFTSWDGIHTPHFVGLRNYSDVIQSPYFGKSLGNLAEYVILTVPIGIGVAFAIALLVDRFTGVWATVFRSAYFVPTIVPLFIAAAVWRWMFTPEFGIIDRLLGTLGMNTSIDWLNDPPYMIPATVMVDVWRSTGFNMVILLAGLNGIPREYYEAARVDGASVLAQIRHITIPELEPVLFVVVINGFISALQVFDLPWLMSSSNYTSYGGTDQGMLMPVMDIMGRAFGGLQFGVAAAYAFMLLLVVLVVTIAQFALRRLWAD